MALVARLTLAILSVTLLPTVRNASGISLPLITLPTNSGEPSTLANTRPLLFGSATITAGTKRLASSTGPWGAAVWAGADTAAAGYRGGPSRDLAAVHRPGKSARRC